MNGRPRSPRLACNSLTVSKHTARSRCSSRIQAQHDAQHTSYKYNILPSPPSPPPNVFALKPLVEYVSRCERRVSTHYGDGGLAKSASRVLVHLVDRQPSARKDYHLDCSAQNTICLPPETLVSLYGWALCDRALIPSWHPRQFASALRRFVIDRVGSFAYWIVRAICVISVRPLNPVHHTRTLISHKPRMQNDWY